jgi:hypothetical protein
MTRIKSIARNLYFNLLRRIADPIENRLNQRANEIEHNLNQRADKYERAVDMRLDERLEAQERRTDEYLLQNRVGIVERTDVMLQIFEQRLDQQRREIRALREALAARIEAAENSAPSNSSSDFEPQPALDVPEPNCAQSPAEPTPSFRKLAENAG